MAPLAAHADQAVRHAVDAYIDGRSLPTFEGDARFETRNSSYRLLDGVLIGAPDATLVGAELVGWLVEYPSRSEVVSSWRNGARAVLVDTRNDGVRGPHIVVTSATRGYRSERQGSAPRLQNAGSGWTQGGSPMTQSRGNYPAPVAPPAPVSPSWGLHPAAAPKTLPPPPAPPPRAAVAPPQRPAVAPPQRPAVAPPQRPAVAPPPMVVRPATPVPPPPRPLPRPLPPPPAVPHDMSASPDVSSYDDRRRGLSQGATSGDRSRAARSGSYPAPTLPGVLESANRSRAHQRGLPLR